MWALPGMSEAVRSHRNHQGRDQVSNEGDTSTDGRWELCQMLTDTPATFYSWTQRCEHDTVRLSFLADAG